MRNERDHRPDRTRSALLVVITLLVLLLFGTIAAFFYVTTPPGKPKVADSGRIRWVRSLYGYGDTKDEQLQAPMDAEFDSAGNVYVTDQMRARIMVFSPGGAFLRLVHKPKPGPGQILRPTAIAFGPDGDMYIADTHRDKVMRFRDDGTFIREWDDTEPLALTVTEERVFVAAADHISIFTNDGELVTRFGKRGREQGELDFPHGIQVDSQGSIWVADGNNTRLQRFEPSGKSTLAIGKPPAGPMDTKKRFGLPVGLSLSPGGHLIMADALSFELLVMDAKGKLLDRYGEFGGTDGMLYYPSGISYDPNRRLLVVADSGNDRAQVFEIDMPGENRLLNRGRRSLLSPLCYGPLALLVLLAIASVVFRRTRYKKKYREPVDAPGEG